MRAIIQRVARAHVVVDGKSVGNIQKGLLTLLGVGPTDTLEHTQKLIEKIVKLRIFEDAQGKMNLSALDVGASHLIVSQFTLYGDCTKGNRPSFIGAAKPELAKELYLAAVTHSKTLGVHTQEGVFQADMKVELVNDGPVTLMIEV